MSIYNDLLKLLHSSERTCDFTKTIVNALSIWLENMSNKIVEVGQNFFFDTLTLDGVLYFEELLDITPTASQTLADRRSAIQAKWLMNNHNSLALIQRVCNAWKNGAVVASFTNGKIKLTFVSETGVPSDLNGLIAAINEVKPAHLPYELQFKYLLKKEIHHILTKSQMETYKKNQYCNVGT